MRYITITDAGTHIVPTGWIFIMNENGSLMDPRTRTGVTHMRRPTILEGGVISHDGSLYVPETNPWFNWYTLLIGAVREANATNTRQYFIEIERLATEYVRKFIPDRMEAFRAAGGSI